EGNAPVCRGASSLSPGNLLIHETPQRPVSHACKIGVLSLRQRTPFPRRPRAPRVDPLPAHNLQPLTIFYDRLAVLSSDGSGSLTSRLHGLKHGLSNQAGRGTGRGTPSRWRASWTFLNHPGVSDGAGRFHWRRLA